MKTLVKKLGELALAGRWDIDFHLPPEGIKAYPNDILKRVDEVAYISKAKRDPSKKPDEVFQYIDIASIDVSTGVIINPQELTGEEAPSRARKVVRAYDIVVSTCRPTRGAISIVPLDLHNNICSTAFSIVRCKEGINPIYLHYSLRLQSTLEQFRKWSTGSSYPAILDEDVKKTLIPVPDLDVQNDIAKVIVYSLAERDKIIQNANSTWNNALNNISDSLSKKESLNKLTSEIELIFDNNEINRIIKGLSSLTTDNLVDEGDDLFSDSE